VHKVMALLLVGLGGIAGCSDGGGDAGGNAAGETIYNRSCFSCHAAGVAGAPVPGDADAWAPRIAKGRDALLRSVKEGIPPGMPPMGLCTTCSDADLAAAIDYMLTGSD
jgi:cytochrome c5